MTPDDIIKLSEVFGNSSPDIVKRKLSVLTRVERKRLAEICFEMNRKIYSTTLENSIDLTFRKIHNNMKKLFFGQIFHVNQKLRKDPSDCKTKLEALREIKLFSNTSDFDLIAISENLEEVDLKANQAFQKQYEAVKGVYLLKDEANIFEYNTQIPVMTRSGIFGDDVCATDEPTSSTTIKPVVDCKALFISKDKFQKLIRAVPGLQEKVFQAAVDRTKQGSIRAEEQRRLTQEILDNIGQGSFSINVSGEIGENYTSLAAEYLGHENLAGIPFADLAFRNNREVLRNYYRALHMLFSGTDFNHSVVIDLLPDELTTNNRTFKLHYSFVQDGASNVMSVFVRMEDVTLERELAEKEEKTRSITARMQGNIGGYMDMLEEVKNSLESVEQFAEAYCDGGKKPSSGTIGEIMRLLHGAKGLSGQFGLNSLKAAIHYFEDWFIVVDREGMDGHTDTFKELLKSFERGYQYALSFKENLGAGIIEILNGVSFTQEKFKVIKEAVISKDYESLKQIFASIDQVPAVRIAGNWAEDGKRLAGKLNKKIEFEVKVEKGLMIPKQLAQTLNTNLGHLYRNSIDHGIESPEIRLKTGKSVIGKIIIMIDKKENDLFINIVDDGKGIENHKIAQIALENKNLDQKLVNEYIRNGEHWKIIFLPGFSSVATVTTVSGRGVGMDAVKNTVESLEGIIDVASEDGEGTTVMIQIPLGNTL